MTNKTFLYGASGHCKVIIDILYQNSLEVSEIFDDNDSIKSVLGVKVSSPKELHSSNGSFIIAIGNNKTRKKIVKSINLKSYCQAIHPKTTIDSSVLVGEGTVIMAGVIVNSGAEIGNHCIVNTSSSIDHDCKIGDYVHISPNATLCGNVNIGECSHIGAGSVIIQGVTIGENVIVGAGSVVISDISDNTTIVGNPARIIKTNNNE